MITLQEAVDYLKFLYEQTGRKYFVGRAKISYLLIIAAFKYAQENKQLLNATIKYYNSICYIVGLNSVMPFILEQDSKYMENNKKIVDTIIDNNKYIKDADIRSLLMDVFINFGAYKVSTLRDNLNALLNLNGFTNTEHNVLLYKFLILNSSICDTCDNDVVNYLFI